MGFSENFFFLIFDYEKVFGFVGLGFFWLGDEF